MEACWDLLCWKCPVSTVICSCFCPRTPAPQVPLRMQVDAISFSAHADFPQTSEFLDTLQVRRACRCRCSAPAAAGAESLPPTPDCMPPIAGAWRFAACTCTRCLVAS